MTGIDEVARQTADNQTADNLAALVLAAGLGTRMAPFTERVPKPLLTVDNEELLGRALRQARSFTSDVAVNAHHFADQIAAYVECDGVHLSHEEEPLGTAGAIAGVRTWLAGRDLLIINGDAWVERIPEEFVRSWDRTRPRLLVKDIGRPSDFGTQRFVGVSLLPGRLAAGMPHTPAGLYEQVWRDRLAHLDLVPFVGHAFDCGTPEEFLEANLTVSGGRSVIHPTAVPGGPTLNSVFLAGAESPPGHTSRGELRDGFGHLYTSQRLARSSSNPTSESLDVTNARV